jgi:hypothetical protein
MKLKSLFVLGLAVLLITACAGNSKLAADREAAKARFAKAEAMFQERCKKAGVFIHRTAENVEGILLLKIREGTNFDDQYKMDDPYGKDSSGEYYIQSFFLEPKLYINRFLGPERLDEIRRDYPGYHYVDAIDPKDGKRYRYTGSFKEVTHTKSITMGGDGKTKFRTIDFVLDRVPAPDPAPRYGVTYDDISTREERDYWIAGSSLRVIDLETNEVMAERIGYMMDRGQGNDSGGRSPWLLAASFACPSFKLSQAEQTRRFVTKVLKPTLENKT